MVACEGTLQLPAKIKSVADLRVALSALGGVPVDRLLAVEMLWTPQAEGDTFSRDDIIRDYADLVTL